MKRLCLAVLLLLFLSACAQPSASAAPAGPTPEVVRMLNLDLALTAMPPTAEPATSTPAPSPTPFPTFTPRPTQTGQAGSAPATPSCSNLAEFVKHLSISDNASLGANQVFAKIWQIKNVGTCTWTTDYKLVFVTGERLNSPDSINIPAETAPGATLDLRLDLTAPANQGSYTGSWMLQAPDGALFAFGPDGSQPITLSISVKPPTPAPPS